MTAGNDTPDQVVVISDYSRVRGGASKLALLLAEQLQQRDIPVTLFCGDVSAYNSGSADDPGLAVRGVAGASLLEQRKSLAAMRGIWNREARTSLAALVEQIDTPRTIYHVHGFLQTLSPSIFRALHPLRERVVIHAHDYFLACPNGAYFDYRSGTECARAPLSLACTFRNCDKRSAAHKLWRVLRQGVQNSVTRDFMTDSRVILIHEDMQDYLERSARRLARPCVIRNPAQPFLNRATQPETKHGFVFVGDIHAYKGVFVLAEAARKAGMHVCFVGDGADRAQLQRDYPEFQFAGWQDRQGLARFAGQARAVIVPSLGPEPFGLTLVEAVASGLPVVISDGVLMAPEVEAAGVGLVFRAGDEDHLAQVLTQIAGDDALVRQMSEKAHATRDRFAQSEDAWCDKIMQLYREMISARAHSALPNPADPPAPRLRGAIL